MVITNVNQVVYQGDGVTTAFPFTFRIIDWTDIKLLLLDSDGTETDITSDYYVDTENDTVHYPGYAPGAEPALSDRPPVLAEGQKLVIYRKLPITQEKDLGDKWPFYVIELGLDKLTMILQDIWDWLGRCLCVSKGQAYEAGDAFDPTIPLEADKVICGNANGTGFDAREAMMEVNGAWDGEGRQIKGVADPADSQDAATKNYVDTLTDNNFMKLQPDGTAWEGRNLPVRNVQDPYYQQDSATKNYVDGIIAGIVAAGNDVVVLDTVAIMKATDLSVGMYVSTAGYHNANDGGNGFYAIRAARVSDVDDGGSIIILNNGNVAELINDGTVNVKQFGAVGDGITDDTTAIQNALNYIPSNGVVEFNNGNFVATEPLVMNFSCSFQKLKGTTPSFYQTKSGILFKDLASDAVGITVNGYATIEDLTINRNGISVGDTTIGISASGDLGVTGVQLRRLSMSYWDKAIYLKNAYYNTIENVMARFNNCGLYAQSCYNVNITRLMVNGTPVANNTGYIGIYAVGSQINATNCSFESYYLGSEKCAILLGNGTDLSLINCYFESYAYTPNKARCAIYAAGARNVNIYNCVAYIYGQESFVYATGYGFSIVSSGNSFTSSVVEDTPTNIYELPPHYDYMKTSILDVKGDKFVLGADVLTPNYVAGLDITTVDYRLPNIHVIPPSLSSPTAITEHEFLGKPQAYFMNKTAPSNPIKGAIYWADGYYWNPLNIASVFHPYPIVYDGSSYTHVSIWDRRRSIVTSNTTLKNFDHVIVKNDSAITVTLPASPVNGYKVAIKAGNGAENVTVDGNSKDIDWNGTTYTLAPKGNITLEFSTYFNQWAIV